MIDTECKHFDSDENDCDVCNIKKNIREAMINTKMSEKYPIIDDIIEFMDIRCNRCENCGFETDDGMDEIKVMSMNEVLKNAKYSAMENIHRQIMLLTNKLQRIEKFEISEK